MAKRLQFDRQWQQDFQSLAKAIHEQREHTAAGLQCRDHGALDAAAHELELAEEAQAQIELLEHALRDLR